MSVLQTVFLGLLLYHGTRNILGTDQFLSRRIGKVKNVSLPLAIPWKHKNKSASGYTVTRDPVLNQNQLRFPYGVNFKYNGVLKHHLNRVWIVTKIPLPDYKNMDFPEMQFDTYCHWMQEYIRRVHPGDLINQRYAIRTMCAEAHTIVHLIQIKEKYLRAQIRKVMEDDLFAAFPSLSPAKRAKRGLVSVIGAIIGLIPITVEAIGSFLHKKRDRAISRSVQAMRESNQLTDKMLTQLQQDFVMYGNFNVENSVAIVDQINDLEGKMEHFHKAITGNDDHWKRKFLTGYEGRVIFEQQLNNYLEVQRFKHNEMLETLLSSLKEMVHSISVLGEGKLPSSLFPPSLLKDITSQALSVVKRDNPEYQLAIEDLTRYYDMDLVTFCLDTLDNSLVVTFPIFIEDYQNKRLALYELETVPVPIDDQNYQADSYTQMIPSKPYLAVNHDFYIQLRIPELRVCKKISTEYFCEELFLVKHKTRHSCESALYFNLTDSQIRAHCNFKFMYNTTIPPSLLDGGSQIVLANMVNEKRLICTEKHDLAMPLPSHNYVLVNRQILCKCQIESDMAYVLSDLSACDSNPLEVTPMYFTINMAFFIYFKKVLNQTEAAKLPLYPTLEKWELPVAISSPPQTPKFKLPNDLRDFFLRSKGNYSHLRLRKEALNHENEKTQRILLLTDRSMEYLTLISSGGLVLAIILILGLCIRHEKMSALFRAALLSATPAMLPLVEAVEVESPLQVICKTSFATMLLAIILTLIYLTYIFNHLKQLAIWKPLNYRNRCDIYIFLCTRENYVAARIRSIPGQVPKFSINGPLPSHKISLEKRYIWDILHVDWNETMIRHGDTFVHMPTSFTVPILDKIRIRKIIEDKDSIANSFPLMLNQMDNWYMIPEKGPESPDPTPPQPAPRSSTPSGPLLA